MSKDLPTSTKVFVPTNGDRRHSITLSSTDLSLRMQTNMVPLSTSSSNTSNTIGKIVSLLGRASPSWSTADVIASENLKTIKGFRNVADGWDGRDAPAPAPSTLNAAEMLTALIASAPSEAWLKLAVGPDGVPAFASSNDDAYLHLVVEPAEGNTNEDLAKLSWFSVKNGQEQFIGEVPFNGRELPANLRDLIQSK